MTTQTEETTGALLLRAAAYAGLAAGFAHPADDSRNRLVAMTAHVAPIFDRFDGEWARRMNRLAATFTEAHVDDLAAEFNRLFSGPMACPPHETSYERDGFTKQHTLADIAGFYLAFGFELPEGSRWQPDDMAVELEFCSLLLQRAAYALDPPDGEGADLEKVSVSESALSAFLTDHLGRWTTAFTDELEALTVEPGYRALASVTRAWVATEVAALGLDPQPVGPRPGAGGRASGDDAPAECGECPATD